MTTRKQVDNTQDYQYFAWSSSEVERTKAKSLFYTPQYSLRMKKILFPFFLSGLLASSIAISQPVNADLPQITNCVALVNAKVVTAPGKAPMTATVVTRNGLITQIGTNLTIPADAYRVAADSLYVYPAFIDAFSYTGLKAAREEEQRGRGDRPPIDEEGNPSLEDAGITPFIGTRATFDPKSRSIEDWRQQGFAIAHVVPRGQLIPGKGAIVVLSGKSTDEVLWREDVSLFSQWAGARGNYPSTVIGMMAKWRELHQNAKLAAQHEDLYASSGMVSRPTFNRAHQALIPVVKKTLPVYFRAMRTKDIYRALELKKDLDLHMVIADATQAFNVTGPLKSTNTSVILSLDMPDDKSEKKKEETKPDSTSVADSTAVAEKDEVETDPEKEAFEKRREESYKAHLAQAATLSKAGIPFAFGTTSGKSSDFFKTMLTFIENGLTKDQALAALTTTPAKLLGIDKYCGTIEAGKMANMVVTNKPLFEEETAVKFMMVEGLLFELEVKEKKKAGPSDPASASAVVGTWSYSVDVPGDRRDGTLTFTQANGQISGRIRLNQDASGNDLLENIIVDKNKLSFSYPYNISGQSVTLEFDLIIDGPTLEGSVAVGEFGTYPVTGRKTDKPN